MGRKVFWEEPKVDRLDEKSPLAAVRRDRAARGSGGWIATIWLGLLIVGGVALTWLAFNTEVSLVGTDLPWWAVFLIVAVIAFLGEYMDSSIGMGFGTILTPVLLILGYSPLQVVPCLLLSETLSGISGGLLHHNFGNVDLKWGSAANRTMLVLALFSVIGTVAAVLVAVNLPKFYVKLYIAVMIIGISLFLLIGARLRLTFSLRRIVALGIVAAFNKGISGGGYGPLITGGQVVLGVGEKSAIGTTTFTEGLVCLTGIVLYLLLKEGGLDWALAVPVLCGALASVPAATWTVRVLPVHLLRPAMGGATLFLGVLLLVSILS